MNRYQVGASLNLFYCILFIMIACLASADRAFAWPATYGIELTFTNELIINESDDPAIRGGKYSLRFQEEWVKEIKLRCPGCLITPIQQGKDPVFYRVTYPDGWWYNINVDPGVLEIQAKPFTLEQLKNGGLAKTIHEDIFGLAQKIGLKPHESAGGGHIHIGLQSAFNESPQLLRNFFVDLQNNSEIYSDVLNQDMGNSPTLVNQSWLQRRGLLKALDIFDHAALGKKIKSSSANILFAELVRKHAYYQSSSPFSKELPERYQALNLERIANYRSFRKEERTLEIRALRPQKNVEELKLIITLFEERLKMLKARKSPLPFERNYFTNPFTSYQTSVDMYYRYVDELGLSWENYKGLMPTHLRDHIPTPLQLSFCEELLFPFH